MSLLKTLILPTSLCKPVCRHRLFITLFIASYLFQQKTIIWGFSLAIVFHHYRLQNNVIHKMTLLEHTVANVTSYWMSFNCLYLYPSTIEILIFNISRQLSKLNYPTNRQPNNVILTSVDYACKCHVIFDRSHHLHKAAPLSLKYALTISYLACINVMSTTEWSSSCSHFCSGIYITSTSYQQFYHLIPCHTVFSYSHLILIQKQIKW